MAGNCKGPSCYIVLQMFRGRCKSILTLTSSSRLFLSLGEFRAHLLDCMSFKCMLTMKGRSINQPTFRLSDTASFYSYNWLRNIEATHMVDIMITDIINLHKLLSNSTMVLDT